MVTPVIWDASELIVTSQQMWAIYAYFRGYFIGIGVVAWLPSASEANVNIMGKYITSIDTHWRHHSKTSITSPYVYTAW